MKLDDGSIVDLKAIPDCDFAFAAAISRFCLRYDPVLSDLILGVFIGCTLGS